MTNSPLLETVTFKDNGNTRLTTAKVHDKLNRLTAITNTPSSSSTSSFNYVYNAANQRTRATREDDAYWAYGYDALGQVISGKKHLANDTLVNGLAHEWTFDDIGNRKTATSNTSTSTYTSNLLNQYGSRTVPGVIDVFGAAHEDTTVTVTLPATGGTIYSAARQEELYFKQLAVNNTSAAQYPEMKITAVLNEAGPDDEDVIAEALRSAFVAETPEEFAHDADGNLTADARWTYIWDAENRLVAMETQVGAVVPNGPLPETERKRLEFAYDGQSRRLAKKVFSWDGTGWELDAHTRFLYDGWNMIAELDALASNAAVRTYVWGLDLSGTFQGAGGVGGLLFASIAGETHAPAFDGNGNVIGYVDMATGVRSATYEYGAFGETLIAEGAVPEMLPFRFSTKYTDAETSLIYYGYRIYQPSKGRWLNRDPLEERGDTNLYRMVSNSPATSIDVLGLYQEDGHFYTVYAVARANGLSGRDAYEYAYYTQYADEDANFDAIPAGVRMATRLSRNRALDLEIQRTLHSLHGGNADDVQRWRTCLRDMLRNDTSLGPWQRGLLTHAFGDAFAHTRNNGTAYDPPYGHGGDGSTPDIPQNRPGLFRRYVETLSEALGGRATAAELNSIVTGITRTPPDGMGKAARHAFVRRYVQRRWGYNEPYNPAGGNRLDAGLPQLTVEQVRDFLRTIRDRCGCEIQNGSTYR